MHTSLINIMHDFNIDLYKLRAFSYFSSTSYYSYRYKDNVPLKVIFVLSAGKCFLSVCKTASFE